MFSIATAPAKQSASDTISVLSGRLGSATLLEDRRAAILGLRSFAKDFPATVASSALRGLIGSLGKDGEDVDTVKVVLETLLMLFTPNEESPEASDEIVLWLADEFTQRQENVTLLLDFLEATDFYSRLYSLQLLGAILSARTERTEECIFTAPLGISRLVATLDDRRDAIRNEGINLLTSLTPASLDIQKLVAFENAFERIFAIIESEGSLSEGGRTVEDCLILLANLLRRNASNQTLFRESGCTKRLADLLHSVFRPENDGDLAIWARSQRNRNVYAYLSVLRLLLTAGSVGVSHNQKLLWKHGLCADVLHLAFSLDVQMEIKAEALITCGDMIRDSATLQESFAQLSVSRLEETAASSKGIKDESQIYVIDGLLDLILNLQDNAAFNVRYAANECLKAYFSNHLNVRLHFLTRAIEGYLARGEETTNALTVLLAPSADQSASDPYRPWFAAVITFHLLYDNSTAKAKALSLTEGDASEDEEVVTSIQTVTAHLLTGVRRGDDGRISVSYLMLLTTWLFEDLDAVNDFLSEGSNVQSLIQAISQPATEGSELVQGLCAMLLGIAYEFSTKDSPVSRTTLHSILTTRLDREHYLDRLRKLRGHPYLRDFETIPQRRDPSLVSGLAEVYFDSVFVNFFKDNYGRIARAIDRSPELEISVMTDGVQKGISRELVDSLREQIREKEKALEEARVAAESQQSRLGQEQGEYRRFKEEVGRELLKSQEEAKREVAVAKAAHEGLQRTHEAELRKLQSLYASKEIETQKQIIAVKSAASSKETEYDKKLSSIKIAIAAKDSDIERRLGEARKAAQVEADHSKRRHEAEIADLRASISSLEASLQKAINEREKDLQAKEQALQGMLRDNDGLRKELKSAHSRHVVEIEQAEKRTKELEQQLEEAKTEVEQNHKAASEIGATLAQSERAKESVQSELDDLLIVFTDLEDQVARQKKRLHELGEPVSDAEDDESDDADDSNICTKKLVRGTPTAAKIAKWSDEVQSSAQMSRELDKMSVSSDSENSDGVDWLDVEPDEEQIVFVSLFGPETFPSIEELLKHCKTQHAFDLVATVRRLALEFHDAIKLVNFVRGRVQDKQNLPQVISADDFTDDKYLKPVLENDALLFSLDEILDEKAETVESSSAMEKTSAEARNKELEAELAAVQERFASYRLAVEETLDKRWGDEKELDKSESKKKKDSSDDYFESYAYNDIHETMLKDEIRTDAYRDFIYENKQLFRGKVVLDIGCGTGILSMFCAKAGAAKVIAVDKSDIIDKARENIFNNGLADTITCLRGAIEDVQLPVDQVDIIVSEWMGYCLLYEAMLPSVLYARDKYLRPDGLLVPSSATIWMAPVQDEEYVTDTVSFWRDVYGFDMKAMQENIYDEARILTMPSAAICGTPHPFKVLDLHTIKTDELVFTANWESRITREIASLDGFLIWFDNFFVNSRDDKLPVSGMTPDVFAKEKPGYVAFTTGPFGKETHWKQGLLLQPPTQLKASQPKLTGRVVFSALEENARALDIQVTWIEDGQEEHSRAWKLK